MSRPPASRRDFLAAGPLAAGAALAHAPRAAAGGGRAKSVVWLWLGGGPPHVETFDPKPDAPAEYRSVTGAVQTSLPGVALGGTFPEIARRAGRFAFVRGFGHAAAGHGRAAHLLHTGHDHPAADDFAPQERPSLGAVLAHVRGPVHPRSGLPTSVRFGATAGDGPGALGPACGPRDAREIRAHPALDPTREPRGVRDRYGPGLGGQLLLARRLCEAGVGFVSIHHGGWDLHGDVAGGVRRLGPDLDRAVAAFVDDCGDRGLDRDVLLVVTGEFGRTPRLNAHGGRDHWPSLTPLLLAGGGLRVGQVVGASSAKAEVPTTAPVTPPDLLATVFHALGLPPDPQAPGAGGRPIPELV